MAELAVGLSMLSQTLLTIQYQNADLDPRLESQGLVSGGSAVSRHHVGMLGCAFLLCLGTQEAPSRGDWLDTWNYLTVHRTREKLTLKMLNCSPPQKKT